MSGRGAAAEQLRRILHILPAASREGGIGLSELASQLGVDQARLLRDLEEVTTRSFYHPAGSAEDLQILVEGDRVRIWTGGEFGRPTKLTPREALAAALGLRALLVDGEEDGLRSRLLARIERELSALGPDAIEDRYGRGPLENRVALAALEPDPDGIREILIEASRERRSCRIVYLKPDAAAPEERILQPWAIAYGEGAWYAIGHSVDADGTRVFRIDRVLSAEPTDDRFEPPVDFDVAEYLDRGRVFRAHEPVDAVIRYSPRIARWLVERIGSGEGADRPFTARHHVSDVGWLVRHALQYGADAEVLEPAEVREMVSSVAGAIAREGSA